MQVAKSWPIPTKIRIGRQKGVRKDMAIELGWAVIRGYIKWGGCIVGAVGFYRVAAWWV